MNRLSVKRIETAICCIGLSVACLATLIYFSSFILASSEPMQDKLYKDYGKWALIYPGLLLLSTSIASQFSIGGILFKKNRGLYGFVCLLPSAIFVVYLGGSNILVQSTIASLLGLILGVYIAKISGAIFGVFDSPVESLNWKEKTLTFDYKTPKIWIIIFDLLILFNILVLPVMLSKITSENYVLAGLFTFLHLAYLYSLIMLRKEKLLGAYLFIIINLGIILFYALNYEILRIAYYTEPYFLVKNGGNILLFIVPLALMIYNRKRLTKQSI